MRSLKSVALAAAGAASLMLSGSAKATLSGDVGSTIPAVQLVRTPIPVANRVNDLTNSVFPRTFDLIVTQADAEQWTVGTLKIDLNTGTMAANTGTFYSPAVGNSDFAPGTLSVNGAPNLAFDTFVTTPNDGLINTAGTSNALIAGKSDYSGGPIANTGNALMPGNVTGRESFVSNGGNSIDVTWSATAPQTAASVASSSGGSSYTIARITLLGKAGGTIVAGHITGTNHLNAAPPDVAYSSFTIPTQGDFNEDGVCNSLDINAAVAAISTPSVYAAAHPNANPVWIGDASNDGLLNSLDINPLVALFLASGATVADVQPLEALVPEPSMIALAALGSMALVRRHRRK
jgi:PEP-CTERM motif